MGISNFEIVELNIYNHDKFIKNVPHKVIATPTSKEYRHSLDVVYRISAICEYLNEQGRYEFDYHDIDQFPEIKDKLTEAKYI